MVLMTGETKEKWTQVGVSVFTREMLKGYGSKGETYDMILQKLMVNTDIIEAIEEEIKTWGKFKKFLMRHFLRWFKE